jgi:hypothetical protein
MACSIISAMSLNRLSRLPALVLPFLIAHSSFAAPKDAKERAAKAACSTGDYVKGVALLAELYVASDDITYIYNQGRCYQQSGRYEEAILRFREYQRKNLDEGHPPDAKTEQLIADCQSALASKNPPTPTQGPAPSAAAVVTAAAAQPAAQPPPDASPLPAEQVAAAQPPPSSAAGAGAGLRIGGITVAAVGAAGIVTGVVLNLKANSLASDLQASRLSYSRDKDSTRSSYETSAWVAYGAGAACLTAGVLLYYLGYREGHSGQVALLPTAGRGEVGAAVTGAF